MRQKKREKRYPRITIKPKTIAIILAVIAALAVAAAIAIALLANTSAFTISSIDTEATEHVSSEDIATLASIPEGTTLLNYDEATIVANLKRNPWIGEVTLQRVFPDRLRIQVKERGVRALVMMNAGAVVWCLGSDNVWIEPLKVEAQKGQSILEAALTRSREMGSLLVTDVPQTIEPVAGEPADDEVFTALATFKAELSEEFWAQVVSFSASSSESIACILTNGVEVSLGAPTNIETKEELVKQLLAKYPNKLTYINVRVPSNPSYRMLGSDAVQEGTGALGDIPGANTMQPQAQQGAQQGGEGVQNGTEGAQGQDVQQQGLEGQDGSLQPQDGMQESQDGSMEQVSEGDDGYADDGYADDGAYASGGEPLYQESAEGEAQDAGQADELIVYDTSAQSEEGSWE